MGYEVDFMPVGNGSQSGDAIAVRFGDLKSQSRDEQRVIVIDGGFKDSGEKLVEHIVKYYKTDKVDLVISTHPDEDHASGLEVVLDKLKVDCLWMHKPWDHAKDIEDMYKDGRVTDRSIRDKLRRSLDTVRDLERIANQKEIPIIEPFADVTDESGQVVVLGPTESFYEGLLPGFRSTPGESASVGIVDAVLGGIETLAKKIKESWGIETLTDYGETTAENDSSVITMINEGDRYLLFTADAGIPALTAVISRLNAAGFDCSKIVFVQVPHHGSHRNIGPTILNTIIGSKLKDEQKNKSAFVSVSKDADDKHPSKRVANAFKRRGAPVHATSGQTKWHYYDAPDRGWTASTPLPFYTEVEEEAIECVQPAV